MFPAELRIFLRRTSLQRVRRWLLQLYDWLKIRIRRFPLLAWTFIVKLISGTKGRGPSGQPFMQSVGRDSCFLPSHDLAAGAPHMDFMLASSPSPANDISAPGATKADEIHELQPSMHIASGSRTVDGTIRVETTRAPCLLSSVGLSPTAPEFLNRYERRETIPKISTALTLAPQSRAFQLDCPVGWKAHVHPEGARYYSNETKLIFTDALLHDPNAFESLTRFLDLIESFFLGNGIVREEKVDLVLHLVKDESEGYSCKYYFADHRARTIFWYDEFEANKFDRCHEVYGAISPQHIGIELSAQYWLHCELFPIALPFTLELAGELRDILVYNIGDAMTATAPTGPYSGDKLLKMLTVVDSMKKNDGSNDGSACVLGRFMWMFATTRVYHFSGEPCARLDQRQSVFGTVPRRSFVIRLVSPLMFKAPLSHLQSLENLYVDELVSHDQWDRITERLCTEWQELTLYATVLLNADIAFLSIPTVTVGLNSSDRSAAQIASYVSVVASLGSIFLGLGLVRQYRAHREEIAANAAAFLWPHSQARFGFESLAILYSLPFAFLIWGTISFLVAFLAMCFQLSDTTTRVLVGCFLFFITLGTLACFVRGDLVPLQAVLEMLRRQFKKRRRLPRSTVV
ncbi:hypothetical protein C8J57DRAFT_1136818 [Mycena rebaudengoi]|nr:hypothetical protein C8J57DRAFT_1136818 [Mycena rebaudengoi]